MFEIFDLKSFGRYIKNLRCSLAFTQEDVSNLSGVSIDTLRRIENGKVLLRYDTLVLLSHAYKVDLLQMLKSYSNSNELFNYYHRIDDLILEYDIQTLKSIKEDFKEFTDSSLKQDLIQPLIYTQFELFIEGIQYYFSNSTEKAITCLEASLSTINTSLNVSNLKAYKLTAFEMRIVLLIALSFAKTNKITKSTLLLEECLIQCNFDFHASYNEKLIIAKIYMNLAYNEHRLDKHRKVLHYTELGMNYCCKHHISYMMSLLLFRKGIAEINLNNQNGLISLKRSISLLLSTNNEMLAIEYLKVLNDKYNIIFDINEF